MNTYVLLHFEHENDVTTIVKLDRATHLQLVHVAQYKSLRIILRTFLCSKCNRT